MRRIFLSMQQWCNDCEVSSSGFAYRKIAETLSFSLSHLCLGPARFAFEAPSAATGRLSAANAIFLSEIKRRMSVAAQMKIRPGTRKLRADLIALLPPYRHRLGEIGWREVIGQYGATFGALIRDARVHEIRQRLAEVMPLLQGSGAAQQGVLARTHPRRRYDDRLRAAFVLPIRIAVDHRK
jgi:hypothetical protein